MGEWAKDQDKATLRRLGSRTGKPPSEPTIRRTLARAEVAKEFEARAGAFIAAREQSLAGRAVAVDGKTLRGSADGEQLPVHLVSVVVHGTGTVISQVRVADKSNELGAVQPVLEPLDLTGSIVTGDALFTQTNVAKYLVEAKCADYLLTVKDNQPTLRHDIEALGLADGSPPRTKRRIRGTADLKCDASG